MRLGDEPSEAPAHARADDGQRPAISNAEQTTNQERHGAGSDDHAAAGLDVPRKLSENGLIRISGQRAARITSQREGKAARGRAERHGPKEERASSPLRTQREQ